MINKKIMKKVFCCFTCERDLVMLDAHYKAIKQNAPDSEVYYVFNEEEKAQGPKGSKVLTASFPRNGNLLGVDCHYGMLQVFKYISELHEKSDIIKIDSDTFFISAYEEGLDMCGTAPTGGYYIKGCMYSISYNCICRCMEYLKNGYCDDHGRIEDGVISMIAAITSEPNKVKILNAFDYNDQNEIERVNSCIFQSLYFSQPDELERVVHFIDCGDSKFLNNQNKGRATHYIDCGDSKFLKDYVEANLPAPMAKARALEFLLDFFTKKKNRT